MMPMRKAILGVVFLVSLTACQNNNDAEIEALKHQVEELATQIENQNQEVEKEVQTYLAGDVQKLIEESTESEFVVESLNLYSADWSRRYGNVLGFSELDQYFVFVDEQYFESVVDRYNSEGEFVILNSVFKYDMENDNYEIFDSDNNLLGNIVERKLFEEELLVNMLDNYNDYELIPFPMSVTDHIKLGDTSFELPIQSSMRLWRDSDNVVEVYLYNFAAFEDYFVVDTDLGMRDQLIQISEDCLSVVATNFYFELNSERNEYDVWLMVNGSEEWIYLGELVTVEEYTNQINDNIDEVYSYY